MAEKKKGVFDDIIKQLQDANKAIVEFDKLNTEIKGGKPTEEQKAAYWQAYNKAILLFKDTPKAVERLCKTQKQSMLIAKEYAINKIF
jgi:hypothetical protein